MAKYIVTGKHGAMEIYEEWVPDGRYKGALCYGDKATLFGSYGAGKRAIERTIEYEHENDFDWETWRMELKRVEPDV